MKKFSKNKKLNKVLNEILNQLEELGLEEVQHYYNEFENESDYNLVQYGNLLIYYSDIRDMYENCGYKTLKRYSNDKVWETYKRQVGYVARIYATNEYNYLEDIKYKI